MPAGLAAGGNLDCDLTRSWGQGPGGARRSRTDDILLAKQALYQLSYGPSVQKTGWGRTQESCQRLS